jgi:hypothetical protein
MFKGANKGEWSELYAFLKLLIEGFAHEADKDLKKKPAKYDFVSLLRDDSGEMKVIPTRESHYGEEETVSRQSLISFTLELFSKIKSGDGAFELAEAKDVLSALGLERIKASATSKTDLLAKIKSPATGEEIDRGFSIKSQLGSPSTLINASSHTRFEYFLPLPVNEIEQIWAADGAHGPQDKIRSLNQKGVVISSRGAISPVFRDNLSFWGNEFHSSVGLLFLEAYLAGSRKISDLCTGNVFGSEAFKYKLKEFLAASALGMMPSKPWDGKHPVHGGYIVVGKNGELLVLSAEKGDDFRDYLFERSSFETPSSSRFQVASLTSVSDGSAMTLTMQIRFQA